MSLESSLIFVFFVQMKQIGLIDIFAEHKLETPRFGFQRLILVLQNNLEKFLSSLGTNAHSNVDAKRTWRNLGKGMDDCRNQHEEQQANEAGLGDCESLTHGADTTAIKKWE